MFTASNIIIGIVAALIIGLSKTAVPGGGLLATPLLAMVVSGRQIAGTMLPLLLIADVFAVTWFGRHARRDVLRPIVPTVLLGFAAGALFYVILGSGGRILEVVIGSTIMLLVILQGVRIILATPPKPATRQITRVVGATGGFTTFVSNAAGPIMNTYLTGIGLPKEEMVGTNSWFYFGVNFLKIPVYTAIGWFAAGGSFFTSDTLRFDAFVAPGVAVGLVGGRWLLPRIDQRTFNIIVLILAGIGATKLLVGV
jgi:uncharacterized protein